MTNKPSRAGRTLLAATTSALCITAIYLWYKDGESNSTSAQKAQTSQRAFASQASPAAQGEGRAARADSSAKAVALWSAPVTATPADAGQVLDGMEVEKGTEGYKGKSARATFEVGALAGLDQLKQGDTISLPLLNGEVVTGQINLVQNDHGWVRIGGQLTDQPDGSFFFNSNGQDLSGMVMLRGVDKAYDVHGKLDGKLAMQEKAMDEVACTPIPMPIEPQNIDGSGAGAGAQAVAPPVLSSRPNATAVIYLDFDGESVTDPAWNGGQTINAQPSTLTAAQITDAWKHVSEDYWSFNIDVTTDVNRYNNAAVGNRMRCIITPTKTAAPTSGGVAYVGSFDRAGSSYSSTIPCWGFVEGSGKSCAEAVSHEIGHTLGLTHDGRTSPSEGYYGGHGDGAVGWAPIMGVGYYKSLTQWSKGEYLNANNQQDDIGIIANATNGFGFVADEAGNTRAAAANLTAPNGSVNQAGIISQSTDSDFYKINVQAGSVNVQANPAAVGADLDILIELQDSSGTVLASSNPDTSLNASINTNVVAGTYYLMVKGTGRGDVLGTGYSAYGSIGAYTLSGTVPAAATVVAPSITSATTASGKVSQAFSYQITASNSPTSFGASGLPAGLSINTTNGLITGTPTAAGTSNVTLSASNSAGAGTATLTLTVSPATVSAPAITSAATAAGTVSQPFSYQIVASNSPTSYGATGLPAGLSVNTSTGRITGTPTTAGVSNVTLSATNAGGTGTKALSLTVTNASSNSTFANATAFTIRDYARASVYPSPIAVSGLSGTITKVTATLKGYSHTYPDDVVALLVGPAGQKVMLMSGAGGEYNVSGVNLTFTDAATSVVPDGAQIVTGNYKPANWDGFTGIPSPAPAGPYSSSMSVFNNTNPNGTWNLYVTDAYYYDSGSISGGWSLTITTSGGSSTTVRAKSRLSSR